MRSLALALAVGISTAVMGDAWAAGPGTVRFAKAATTNFDPYTRDPTPAQQQWMRTHYWRMRAYSPYFDSRLWWFPNAWVYKDLYAIYRDEPLAEARPDWILRDAVGNRLYIPFECSGGVCTQYAGDIGNPGFRARWIQMARDTLSKGYVGLFVDDVNMDRSRVSNGDGVPVVPRDPRTGAAMTNADWRRYMAEFTEEIRRAFPAHEIIHNALWFFGHDDPFIQRQTRSADYINIERVVNDPALEGGDGEHGFDRLLDHIDWLHDEGKGVVFDTGAETPKDREYGLAAYFLLDAGRDTLGNGPASSPDDWWCGYDMYLGAPLGSRYSWNGVLRRDFERGFVLVNPPGAPVRTLTLADPVIDILTCGRPTSVTLGPAEGVVLPAVPQ
jgi:hypothetical protein